MLQYVLQYSIALHKNCKWIASGLEVAWGVGIWGWGVGILGGGDMGWGGGDMFPENKNTYVAEIKGCMSCLHTESKFI